VPPKALFMSCTSLPAERPLEVIRSNVRILSICWKSTTIPCERKRIPFEAGSRPPRRHGNPSLAGHLQNPAYLFRLLGHTTTSAGSGTSFINRVQLQGWIVRDILLTTTLFKKELSLSVKTVYLILSFPVDVIIMNDLQPENGRLRSRSAQFHAPAGCVRELTSVCGNGCREEGPRKDPLGHRSDSQTYSAMASWLDMTNGSCSRLGVGDNGMSYMMALRQSPGFRDAPPSSQIRLKDATRDG